MEELPLYNPDYINNSNNITPNTKLIPINEINVSPVIKVDAINNGIKENKNKSKNKNKNGYKYKSRKVSDCTIISVVFLSLVCFVLFPPSIIVICPILCLLSK